MSQLTPAMQRTLSIPPHELDLHTGSFSADERAQVVQQLERMLASPLFSHSKRYAPFLRYIVEKGLEGEEGALKERIIGIEVLGRAPDYDSNSDPAVRVTAGEVRRRIAQYYQEFEHQHELRISLYPGSYLPKFGLMPADPSPAMDVEETNPHESIAVPLLEEPAPVVPPLLPSEPEHLRSGTSYNRLALIAIALLLAIGIALGATRFYSRQDVVKDWWGPALNTPAAVTFCVGMIDDIPLGSQAGASGTAAAPTTAGDFVRHRNHVGLVDVIALERFASILSRENQPYRTLPASSTTFADLRSAPVVLVAGLNNPWTLRITDPMRFHFVTSVNEPVNEIRDRQDPAKRWSVDFSAPSSTTSRDYALIARLHNVTTDQPIFIAAGLGSNGTSAAAEFMTSDAQLKDLIKHLPPNWKRLNIEAVIETDVIGNQPGPPTLVALHTW